jgi:hypothetical protein
LRHVSLEKLAFSQRRQLHQCYLQAPGTCNLSETARDHTCTIEFASAGRGELQRWSMPQLLQQLLLLLRCC